MSASDRNRERLAEKQHGVTLRDLEPIGDLIPAALLAWASDCDLAAQRLRRLYRAAQEREARAA